MRVWREQRDAADCKICWGHLRVEARFNLATAQERSPNQTRAGAPTRHAGRCAILLHRSAIFAPLDGAADRRQDRSYSTPSRDMAMPFNSSATPPAPARGASRPRSAAGAASVVRIGRGRRSGRRPGRSEPAAIRSALSLAQPATCVRDLPRFDFARCRRICTRMPRGSRNGVTGCRRRAGHGSALLSRVALTSQSFGPVCCPYNLLALLTSSSSACSRNYLTKMRARSRKPATFVISALRSQRRNDERCRFARPRAHLR